MLALRLLDAIVLQNSPARGNLMGRFTLLLNVSEAVYSISRTLMPRKMYH